MDQSLLPNVYEFISRTHPFSQLNDLERDAIAAAIKISYRKQGDVLTAPELYGTGLFIVRTGAAEQRSREDTLLARYEEGGIFGSFEEDDEQSGSKVVFLENTLLYFIEAKVIRFLISKNRAVGDYFNSKEWVRLKSAYSYSDADDLSGDPGAGARGTGTGPGSRTVLQAAKPNPTSIAASATIRDAAKAMNRDDSTICLVTERDSILGLVSKTDINYCVAAGLDPDAPAQNVMTREVISVDGAKPLFQALELMIKNNVHCLPVINEGKLYGTLSPHEMFRSTTLQTIYVISEIAAASDVEKLIRISAQTKEIFATLAGQNVRPQTVQRVMSHIADRFCTKILDLAVQKYGPAPCGFAFIAAGSLAREELQILSDQDNAIILERDLSEKERAWFNEFTREVAENLNACGYPLCDGNYMASNEKWCVSLDKWKEYYASWISDTDNDAMLNSQVFLDTRFLYGQKELCDALQDHLIALIRENSRFLATLCSVSCRVSPPLGLFRQFVLSTSGENANTLNIKKQAINLIVEMARVYGLAAGCKSADTYRRLKCAVEQKSIEETDYRELCEAYTFLNELRITHQLQCLKENKPFKNTLEPLLLSQFERNHLRDAFRIVARHQEGALYRFTRFTN